MTLALPTTSVDIPFPESDVVPHLRIVAVACLLQVRPGSAEPWVHGTYRDPGGRIDLHISQDAGGAEIRLGTDISDLFGLVDGPPRLELNLGTARPFSLSIDSGATETRLELGGVPLTRLIVSRAPAEPYSRFQLPILHRWIC